MEVIFFDYGIEISVENGRYFINFDEGELVSRFRTIEITYEEAEKAKRSPKDAYEVIISFQNKERKEKMKE
ncbi:hypothetical protein SAMN05877753_11131 [Bacillus oleivorans]|uniref:Uncharacterized protein n=1 Tax=Bacillus oleivorans TaxID=1448271 RepID=A0A285D7A9_9BACI|nr:hypothetical protein [Bacillus oleivorans]SNX75148.1 hypothetical protein SAMN05877753_11131 [Bacillus oleivorans]